MAVSLPYLLSYKNVPTLFDKIASAKIPETFSRSFLQTTIGLKSTADRSLIPLLRNLGFLDQAGRPTPAYRLLKGDKKDAVLAEGIQRAYKPLFDSDQDAQKLTGEKLKSLVAQIAGTDDDLTGRIAGTFTALVKVANFEAKITDTPEEAEKEKEDKGDSDNRGEREDAGQDNDKMKRLRTEFHYNIQVHLPSNGTEETYLNIFNALRKTFQ